MSAPPSAKGSPLSSSLTSLSGSFKRKGALPGINSPGSRTLLPTLTPGETAGFDDYFEGDDAWDLGEDSSLIPAEMAPPDWTLGWGGKRKGGGLPPIATSTTRAPSVENQIMTPSTMDVFSVTANAGPALDAEVEEFQKDEFMWNQETPREAQDMTRSWVAGEKDLDERRGGGRRLLRETEVDSNEYGFGRGLRNIQHRISRVLRGQPHSEATELIYQIRDIRDQQGYPHNLAERIDDVLARNGASVSTKDCHDFVKRVGVYMHPLLKLELLVEEVFAALQSENKVTFNRIVHEEDEEDETILLNQAGLRMKTGHYHPVTCLAMSPDGALLASADEGGTILLWSMSDGEQQRRHVHEGGVVALAFTHSQGKKAGDVLLSVGADRCLKALDVATWTQTLNVQDIHDDKVTDMAAVHRFAPICATSSSDGTVRVWGLGTAADIGVGDEDTWSTEGSSSTGSTYLVSKFDHEVVEEYLRQHPAFDELGDDELSALTSGMAVKNYDALERIYSEAESSDLENFYILYEGAAFETRGTFSTEGPTVTHYFSKGEVFGERESLGNLKAREASVTCSESSMVLSCPRAMYERLQEGGDWMHEFLDLYEAANKPLWRVRSSNLTSMIPQELLEQAGPDTGPPSTPSTPSRRTSSDSMESGVTGLFAKVKRMDRVKERFKRRVALRKSDDLKRACALFSRNVKMPHGKWRLLQTLKGHEDVVTCVAVDSKGRVASGSQDYAVKLWQGRRKDTVTSQAGVSLMEGWSKGQECVATMKGHIMWVSCVAFAKEDTLLLTGSWDEMVQIWSAEEGDEGRRLRTFAGSRGWVMSIAVFGTCCTSVENVGGVLRVWDIESGKEIGEMHSRRELKFDAFVGMVGSADGIFTAFGEGRNVVLIDATGSRGIDKMAVPGPGRVMYLEDLTHRIGFDPRVPAVVILKGEKGPDVHADLEEMCQKQSAEKVAELRKDAKAVREVSTEFLKDYRSKTFSDEDNQNEVVQVKVREHFTQEGSLWLGGEMCDVEVGSGMSVVTCHSEAKSCVVCTEPMTRGRYTWDIRMEGSGHGGFAKGVSFGIVSTNLSCDEIVDLDKGLGGIDAAGGSVFVMRSSLGRVTIPAGCAQVGPDADLWAPMPRKKAVEGGEEGDGDQTAVPDEGPAKPLRIKELGMQGDRVKMGFSTFTRIFWIHTMPKNGGESLFKCEVPASCVPVLDWKQKGENALKILPIVQLEGQGWNMSMSRLEHEIAVKPSLRTYAQLLSDAFALSTISREEVVKFKGQTVTVDCQPWLPPGQGLVGGREVTLTVPRGAIPQLIKMTITVCNPPRGSDEFVSAKATAGRDVFEQGRMVGVAVDIQPHGLVFDRPAILTIPHAAVLEDGMDWLEEAEMVQMSDFYTVQELATGTMRTLQGATFDSRNSVLPIRETGIYAIKASHNVMDLIDIGIVPMDEEEEKGLLATYNVRKHKRRGQGTPLGGASPLVKSPADSKSASPRVRGRGTRGKLLSRTQSPPPDSRMPGSSMSLATLGTTLTAEFKLRRSASSKKNVKSPGAKSPRAKESRKEGTKSPGAKDVKKDNKSPRQQRGGEVLNKITSPIKPLSPRRPVALSPMKPVLAKHGSADVLVAPATEARWSAWYEDEAMYLPDVYVDEPPVKLRLIMCSPLCQNPLFRDIAYAGSNTLPYSSIITKVGMRQDNHLLGLEFAVEPLDYSYVDKSHGVLTEWRGSPVALELEMGAKRMSDQAASTALDDPSNWEQSCTLVLSLRGIVGDDVREMADVWKDGEYAQLPRLAQRQDAKQYAQFCSLGPYVARVFRVDPLEKVKRATHRMQVARLVGGKKMGSKSNAKNKLVTSGWDVLMVSEDERNVLMQHKLVIGLNKLGWTVKRSPPLWGENEEAPHGTGATEQALRAGELASACKATVIFLTPSLYEKLQTANQEMQLVRAVLRTHGEGQGGLIVPVLLPPYAEYAQSNNTGRGELVRMASSENATGTDPWAGFYGTRLKKFEKNAVCFREDHDELCQSVHQTLLRVVKSGPYGSEDERREFFSPTKNMPLASDALLSLPSDDYSQRTLSLQTPQTTGLLAQSGHSATHGQSSLGQSLGDADAEVKEQAQRWKKQRAGVVEFLKSLFLGKKLDEEMELREYMQGLVMDEQDMWHVVEEEYGVQIDPEEGENVGTIGELVQLIQSRLPG